MSKRSLNLNRAVSNHPANQGLVGWWLSLPGMVGGPKYWDITQFRNHAVSTYNNPHVAIEKRFGRVKPFGGWSKGFYANGLTNFPDIDLSSPFTFTCVIISISSGSGGVVEFYNNASPQTGIGVDSYGAIKTYVAGPGGTILLNTGPDGWRNPGIYHVVYTQDQTYSYVYVNGKYFTSADSSGSRKTGAIRNLCLVGDPLAFLSTSSSVGDVRLSRGWVSSSTVGFLYSQYRRDYPDLLAYRSWVSFAKPSSGGTGITGTGSTTAGTTTTGTATVAIAGTAATTAGTTSSGTAAVKIAGTAATTAGTTASGTGTVTITGTASTSAGTVTVGTGATVVGAVAVTTAGTTTTGTGTVKITGTGVTTAGTTTLASGNTTGTISPISGTATTTAGTVTTGTAAATIAGTGTTSASTNTVAGGVVRITSTGTTNAGTVTVSTGTTGGGGGPTVDSNVYVFLLGA